jgi:hypothetical protein
MSLVGRAAWAAGEMVVAAPGTATFLFACYGATMAAAWTLLFTGTVWTWAGAAHGLLFFVTAVSPLFLLLVGYTAALVEAERRV